MSFALAFNLIGYQVQWAVWIDWAHVCGGFKSKAAAHEWAKERGLTGYKVKAY